MPNTLLLCFIHGFKGGDDTFATFPDDLKNKLAETLPKLDIKMLIYPKFETRGDLLETVARFREWLLEKVIDIEVANGTPSPTVDPSVRTILVGHSMGGIVAAETLAALCSDKLVGADESDETALMFPYIQGVLAFDTPYLGISPGVVAHNAEGHYKTASTAISTLSEVSNLIWGSNAAAAAGKSSVPALPPPPSVNASSSSWSNWSRLAAYAGAATAVAAGSAVAYKKRAEITEGWTWVGSHLEFVGCLVRGEDLKKRVVKLLQLNRDQGVGFANLYTELGKGAKSPPGINLSGAVMGAQRTFCNLPKSEVSKFFHPAVNDTASNEITAHMTMFIPKDNPGYQELLGQANSFIDSWVNRDWYESSHPKQAAIEDAPGP